MPGPHAGTAQHGSGRACDGCGRLAPSHPCFAEIPTDARDVVVVATNGWGERFLAHALDNDQPSPA